MKGSRLFFLLLALLLTLAACSGPRETADRPQEEDTDRISGTEAEPAGFLAQASPETSALILWKYDGDGTVTTRTLYDREREEDLLDQLNQLAAQVAEAPDLSGWSSPCYGVEIGSQEGQWLSAAYWNGYWVAGDGTVYQTQVDFASLWTALEGEDEAAMPAHAFPCAGYLAQWSGLFLEEREEEPVQPEGVTLTVDRVQGGIATFTLTNHSGETFSYGEGFSLEREQNGAWYLLPPQSELSFHDLAYLLEDGERETLTYDLTPWGDLVPGHYRIEQSGLYGEFTLAAVNDTAPEGLSMTVTGREGDVLQVVLENTGEEPANYWAANTALYQRDEAGLWQEILPQAQVVSCGVADPLDPGDQVEIQTDLSPYGPLEPGEYLLVYTDTSISASFIYE